jgi:hypothetical protein
MNNRRRSSDQEIGYLRALAEQSAKADAELKDELRALRVDHREANKETKQAIEDLRDELGVYKVTIRTLKAVAGVVVLVITLQFGDIQNLWENK